MRFTAGFWLITGLTDGNIVPPGDLEGRSEVDGNSLGMCDG